MSISLARIGSLFNVIKILLVKTGQIYYATRNNDTDEVVYYVEVEACTVFVVFIFF